MNKKMPTIIKGMLIAVSGILAAIALLIGSYESGKQTPADPAYGAVSGNEIQGNEFVSGGLHFWNYSQAMVATSSNACSIKTPNATTTFVGASAATRMTTNNLIGSTVVKVGIAFGLNTWATTTGLESKNVTAGQNVEVSIAASSTPPAGLNFNLLAPNSYVNFYTTGTSTSQNGLQGICTLRLVGVQ